MTANLQPKVTVEDAARLFNISPRVVYMARRLQRTGRIDLCDAVTRGEMTVHKALKLAEGKPLEPDRYANSLRAWNAASPDDRRRLLIDAEVITDEA